jgi:hypothetical protein
MNENLDIQRLPASASLHPVANRSARDRRANSMADTSRNRSRTGAEQVPQARKDTVLPGAVGPFDVIPGVHTCSRWRNRSGTSPEQALPATIPTPVLPPCLRVPSALCLSAPRLEESPAPHTQSLLKGDNRGRPGQAPVAPTNGFIDFRTEEIELSGLLSELEHRSEEEAHRLLRTGGSWTAKQSSS